MKRCSLAAGSILMTAALVLTACAAAGDKSGVPNQPISLVLANSDGDTDGIPAVMQFVDRVQALSGGRVSIIVKSQWNGNEYDEAGLIRDVAAGRADLGWSGTRALDLVGVDAFRPLQAPFLVTSLSAEAAIINDPLAQTLLASLKPVGVTGLAVLADEIRHPVGVAKPLLTVDDFRGITFQTYPSGAQSAAITALGAVPTTDPVGTVAAHGQLGGFESMWWTIAAHSYPDVAPYISANVGLWPRSSVLFANPSSLAGLDPQARQWVMTAGEDASQWSATHALDRQDDQIQQVCGEHARLAMASDDQLAALRKAVEPMYATLRADPALRPTLERIEQLAAAAPPDPPISVPSGCSYRAGEEDETTAPSTTVPVPTAPGDSGSLPEGVYRYSTTENFLLGHGASDHDAFINAGVFTWTLRNGRWHSQQVPIDPSVDKLICDGYYDVRGTLVVFSRTTVYTDGDCAPTTWTATWSATADTLTWSDASLGDGFAIVWAPRPWKKIG